MPSPVLALPCGSKSMTRTRFPTAASAVARLTAVVVLPTPPFWLTIARIRGAFRGAAMLATGSTGSSAASSGAVMVCTDHLFQLQHRAGGIRETSVRRGTHIPRFGRLGQFLADRLALQSQQYAVG